jgi:hypothetical protein
MLRRTTGSVQTISAAECEIIGSSVGLHEFDKVVPANTFKCQIVAADIDDEVIALLIYAPAVEVTQIVYRRIRIEMQLIDANFQARDDVVIIAQVAANDLGVACLDPILILSNVVTLPPMGTHS